MAKPFTPTPHPVLGLPTPAQMAALGQEAWAKLMLEREQRIQRERNEPFPHWYEPPIWKVCDALLGFPWVDADWARRMREHLGFPTPVKILLINGGNRGGKSEYASDRVMRVLRTLRNYRDSAGEPPRAWCLHSTLPMSRQYQQPLFWSYLPAELRAKDYKTRVTYIAYKQKTGFSEENFVLPDGADCVFKAYEQDRRGIEGGNVDIIWPDELVPSDWVETMDLRIAEKGGWMIITFTPVDGYTETVRLFQDGAEVVKESTAFLLPKDGGPADEARALGLTEAELEEVKRADAEKRASIVPQSRPENCNRWIEGGGEGAAATLQKGGGGAAATSGMDINPVNSGQMAIPAGREFETVPRVLKCVSQNAEQQRACVFFHTSDNPYGNPKSVWSTIAGKSADFKRERFYGIATKNFSARFPKFNVKVHVVRPDQIPQTKPETIQERFMDSRFASTPKMERDRPVTLIEEFADLNLHFTPTPGDDIEEGVQLIQDALAYDDSRPVDFFNQPRLFISNECQNMIYALTTWTGYTKEGRRNMEGATKDPIDLLRYFFLSDCGYLGGNGTNYLFVDPAGRNFFMAWFRVTARAAYVVREWPGNYVIPGVGLPGPWALPDGKHPDGKRGPAQKAFGWGHMDYKREIARLEGWPKPPDLDDAGLTKERRDELETEWQPAEPAETPVPEEEEEPESEFVEAPKHYY